jgi:ribonuclease HI
MSKKNFFAVRKGRKPGIYTDWYGENGAEAQVRGFMGAEYKGFSTRGEAHKWLAAGKSSQTASNKSKTEAPANVVTTQALFPGDAWQVSAQAPSTGEKPIEKKSASNEIDPAQALADGKMVIYTDGACEGNPGRGGYGVVVLYKKKRKELSGGFHRTTNNRMELMAGIVGLEVVQNGVEALLFSDSRYLVNGLNRGWASRWRQHGWMRTKTDKAENADLWARLLELVEGRKVQFIWVRGHAGNKENERCDQLAVQALSRPKLSEDENYSG